MALHARNLRVLSLCTGGAGLDLGLELAIPDARTICMVEREAFAVSVLVAAMEAGFLAPAPIWSDVTTFNGRAWRGVVDCLIGGIPCQPHSLAGRKRGQKDHRDLWSDTRRIIVQARPRVILIENVSGMLSAGADEIAGAERVCRDLHKLGFQVEGGLFTASEVGAPHQRERVFILAVADDESRGWGDEGDTAECGESQAADRGGCGDIPRVDLADAIGSGRRGKGDGGQPATIASEAGSTMVDTPRIIGSDVFDGAGESGQQVGTLDRPAGRDGYGRSAERGSAGQREDTAPTWFRPIFPPGPNDRENWKRTLQATPELEPSFRRVADGLAGRLDIARVDRLRLLGNGVVPLEAGYAIRTLVTRLATRGSAGAARLVRMMSR